MCSWWRLRKQVQHMTNVEQLKILHRIRRTLLCIEQMLDLAEAEREAVTMVDPKIAALCEQFDTATNAIAVRIQKLIDAGGLSPESEAALTSEVAKLNALGKDPENPVPEVA